MHKILHNPAIGHWIQFIKTSQETNGKLLQLEYGVANPESVPAIPYHKHLKSLERFEVLSGQLGVNLDGKRRVLNEGEQLYIPPGTPHTFWNAGSAELRFITDVQPPGGFQIYWETVFGLAEDGKVDENGLPNLLQLAVVAPMADSYDPRVPVLLMKGIVFILGGIGRLLGYKACYPEYQT